MEYLSNSNQHKSSNPGNETLSAADIEVVYFIGIGGIGMSALARYFHFHGKKVSGYDKTATVLTKQLEAEGIVVHYEDDLTKAPKEADIVVYTPAIPKEHSELQFYKNNGYRLLKRSEVLGMITRSSFTIGVAGTHGKTTITTMIAHILRHSEYGCNAFLGGIAANYNSNYWSSERNVSVVEADEYDRSFLQLSPDVAVITAMDADHLDIYGTAEAVEQAFIDYSGKLKKGGLLVYNESLKRNNDLKGDLKQSYGINQNATVYADAIVLRNGGYEFSVVKNDWVLEKVNLNMGGMHNVENVTAAIAVAHHLGIEDEKIKAAVAAFRGVKRRFEYIIAPGEGVRSNGSELVMVDDYAHHPEELRALITGAKALFPDMKCTVVFQPHLFSRTRDFADGFASVLDLANEVILLPIYPARELPMEGVTSEMITGLMKSNDKKVLNKEQLLKWAEERNTELNSKVGKQLLLMAGAGDIDTMLLPVKEIFEKGIK